MTELNPQNSPASVTGDAPPSVAVMPTLSPEEILKAQIETLTIERDSLSDTVRTRGARIQTLETQVHALQGKLGELEKNPFVFTMSNLDAGSVLEELGGELTALTAAVVRRDTKGTLTLKLSVKPEKNVLFIAADITSNPPKPDRPKGIFYGTEEGDLSRNDPRQQEFRGFGGRRPGEVEPDPMLR